MVLCHQNFDHTKSNQPKEWHFDGSSSDNRCGIYIFKDKTSSETDKSYRGQVSGRRPTKRISKPKPAPIPAKLKLLRLPAPQCGPEPCKPIFIPKGVSANAIEITYSYSDTQKVVRFEWPDATNPKGHDKTYRQFHLNPNGEKVWNKGRTPWPAYRIDEVLGILENTPVNEPVVPLMLEGELNVELGRTHSIGGITLQGSDWSDEQIKAVIKELQQVNCQALPYLYDNDDRGIEKANKIKTVCSRLQFPCILIDPVTIFPGIPEKGDIKEILDNMDAEEFIRRLEEEIHRQAAESARATELDDEYDRIHEENLKYDDGPDLKKEFNQQALEFLFGDKPWICADGKLYYWTGTYYKYSPDSEQRPRIASYCDSFPVFKEKKGLTYPYANPASAKQVLEWAKMRLEINSDSLNPPGLNCTNGVLQLHWEAAAVRLAPTPLWELVEHNPAFYYTYEPLATYNPEASTAEVDRLMEVLSAPQQDIFLKTIAASLDLETVRKYKGRMVRALLLKGYGSNGKDTLREIVSLMYGRCGMTAATLSDFASYDEGRKFPLSRTADSRVNWASENAQTARLDKIQSLKAFITGDTLSREGKGKDEVDFTPKAIAIFNCNDTPNMQGSLEAIKSRYGVLSFDKTFKVKADPTRGEIEADPRFKYDPDFLKTEVLPAFLNKVLNALVALMSDGIDYAATEAAMAAIQAENSHLFQFSQDTGLNYSPDDVLTASDIWTKLEAWYQDNGTLVYETTTNDKVKAVWFDQPRRGDHNVKGANQVLARIQQLFPKATRATIYSATAKKSVPALKGIGFVATRPSSDPVPTQHPPQETLTGQDGRPTRPSFSNFEQNQEILEEAETETETNIENLADNFVPETVEPVKTGSGGSEPLNINVSICGSGAETGSGDAETGSGGIEKPIAPMVNWNVGERVKVSVQYPTQEYIDERATVVKVWPDGLCRIELDREITVIGGKPTKQFNLNGRYLVSESATDLNLNEEELELVNLMRFAISQSDPLVTDAVKKCLRETSDKGLANRKKVWFALTASERTAFKALLAELEAQPQPEQP
jgi:putative DNA primase/helicase